MRGIPSLITDIRKKVFVEVARMAYAGNGYEAANELPYKIVPGDRPLHRESAFLERRLRPMARRTRSPAMARSRKADSRWRGRSPGTIL